MANVHSQPHFVISVWAMTGVSTAPTNDDMVSQPCAGPRSEAGNHRANTRAELGSAPASPAPNRKRTHKSRIKPLLAPASGEGSQTSRNGTAPVNAVNADHQSTMRTKTPREPYRSPQ